MDEKKIRIRLAKYLEVRSTSIEICSIVNEDVTSVVRFNCKGIGYMAVMRLMGLPQIYKRID